MVLSRSRSIEETLRLKTNKEKSGVVYIGNMKYLGFGFMKRKEGFKCYPHKDSKAKFKRQLKKLTSRKRPGNFLQVVKELNMYLVGWINYFGIGLMTSFMKEMSGW